jgi:hypothetical protein
VCVHPHPVPRSKRLLMCGALVQVRNQLSRYCYLKSMVDVGGWVVSLSFCESDKCVSFSPCPQALAATGLFPGSVAFLPQNVMEWGVTRVQALQPRVLYLKQCVFQAAPNLPTSQLLFLPAKSTWARVLKTVMSSGEFTPLLQSSSLPYPEKSLQSPSEWTSCGCDCLRPG